MSQRLLVHLYGSFHQRTLNCDDLTYALDASRERRNDSIDAAVTITQNIDSARDVSRAIRTQFENKSAPFELTVPDFDSETITGCPDMADDVGVSVRIERTMKLDRRSRAYELENYSRTGRPSREFQSRR